ncbi:hypothetical protein [Thermincola potens]|uniref:hypothetical protein n=1 Tax=Thermincola potens TaxID=863643 RepID=UPI0012FD94B6|nr:hypothetical protein [Thermincola potens]
MERWVGCQGYRQGATAPAKPQPGRQGVPACPKMVKAAGKSGPQPRLRNRTGGGLTYEKCNMSHRVRERCLPGQVLQHKAPW